MDQQWISNGSCKSKDLDYYFNLALDYEYREIAQLLIAAGADGLVIECPYCGTMPVPSDLYNAKLCDHVVCVFDADKNMINEELIELPFAEYASTTYRSDIDEIFLTLSHVAELYDHDFSQPPSHYDFLNALCKDSSAIKSDQVGDLLFVYAKDDNVIDKHLEDFWSYLIKREKLNSLCCPICGDSSWAGWEVSIEHICCEHLVVGWDDSEKYVSRIDKEALSEFENLTYTISTEGRKALWPNIDKISLELLKALLEQDGFIPSEILSLGAIMKILYPDQEVRYNDQPSGARIGWEAVGYFFENPEAKIDRIYSVILSIKSQLMKIKKHR